MASYRENLSTDRFEKRKIHRFPVQLPVELGYGGKDLSSICTNISSEGVSVETSSPLSIGERVMVRVVIAPSEDPLRMLGQVVWKRDTHALDTNSSPVFELGIRFIKPLPTPWKTNDSEFHSEFFMEEEDLDGVPPF